MWVALVKGNCVVAIEGNEKKLENMREEVFKQKNELTMTDMFLALHDSIMFNVAEEKTVKGI